MKKLVVFALLAFFAVAQPINAAGILSEMRCSYNPAQLMEAILCPSGVFSAEEARRFLFQLKQEVKKQHGIDLDLNLVMEEAIRTMVSIGKFSQAEINAAQEFYSELINPKPYFSNKKTLCNKHKSKQKKEETGTCFT